MSQEAHLAVLFADVSGSTQLYDRLGNVRARNLVAHSMSVMTEVTHRHGGTLVKTIGDEVMATFPNATAAVEAACEMQDIIPDQVMTEGRPLAIRVGFHFGPALLDNFDVFGDAVNLAARMASQAKAGQILTTATTVERLDPTRRKLCRQIDLAQVRGKREEIGIYEVIWRSEDATIMHAPWAPQRRDRARLVLTAGGTRLELDEGHTSLTIGRADQNDLVLQQPVVSRLHARIEYRNGRFVLTDLSANGTYVAAGKAGSGYIHRDTYVLTGSGMLGLGEAISPGSPVTVRYEQDP